MFIISMGLYIFYSSKCFVFLLSFAEVHTIYVYFLELCFLRNWPTFSMLLEQDTWVVKVTSGVTGNDVDVGKWLGGLCSMGIGVVLCVCVFCTCRGGAQTE